MERNKNEIMDSNLTLERLLESRCFAWKDGENKTIKEKVVESTFSRARETVVNLFSNLQGEIKDVIETVARRAESWGYLDCLDHIKLWGVLL